MPSKQSSAPFIFKVDQIDAWRDWFYPLFDISEVQRESPANTPFYAENKVWDIGGLLLSSASAPASRVSRGKINITRSPVDHWVITYNRRGHTTIASDKGTMHGSAGIPFVWSLGDRTVTDRSSIDRIQLLIPRDLFRDFAPRLDSVRGAVLDTPLGKMFGDYLLFLERHLGAVAAADLQKLSDAVRGMLRACLAPSAEHAKIAAPDIELSRRERICRIIQSNLRSASLTPATICKAAGVSRSQLYRLFEASGGVLRYVQRQRLLQAHAALSDPEDMQSVASLASSLCFRDASNFGRAFRREFGHSPSDVKAAAIAGFHLLAPPPRVEEAGYQRFTDFLALERHAS